MRERGHPGAPGLSELTAPGRDAERPAGSSCAGVSRAGRTLPSHVFPPRERLPPAVRCSRVLISPNSAVSPCAPPAPLVRLLGSYRLAAVPASRSIGTPFTSY